MNNLSLTPAPKDVSVEILNQLLGPGWEGMLANQDFQHTVLGSMFMVFNNVVLAVVSAMFIYIVFTGVLATAHQGQVLGRRYSTLWTPIRSVTAIVMLMPWVKGFSVLQALILAFTYYGIGAADHVWNTALEELNQRGGTLVSTPSDRFSSSTAGRILMTMTYQEVLRKKAGYITEITTNEPYRNEKPSWYQSGWNDVTTMFGWDGGQKQKKDPGYYPIYFLAEPTQKNQIIVPRESLGWVKVPCMSNSSVCKIRRTSTLDFIANMREIADELASNFVDGKDSVISPDKMTLLNRASADFERRMSNRAVKQAQLEEAGLRNGLEAFTDRARDQGWATAGMWYWTIAGYHDRVSQQVLQKPVYIRPDQEFLNSHPYGKDIVSVNAAVQRYVSYNQNHSWKNEHAAASAYEENTVVAKLLGYINRNLNPGLVMGPARYLTDEGDPIQNLQSAGRLMIAGGYALFAAKVGVVVGASVLDGASKSLWGSVADVFSGGISNGIASGARSLAQQLDDPLFYFSMALFVLGFFLAYYLPSIPFIIFTFGLIIWLLKVAEALILAPLWAGAHAFPDGEGFAGPRASKGYMLFLDVLLRPMLMIFGYFMAVILFRSACWFIGESYRTFSAAAQAGTFEGPASFIWKWYFLSAVIIVVSHVFFGLITWIPNRALAWLGEGVSMTFGDTTEVKPSKIGAEVTTPDSSSSYVAQAVSSSSGQTTRDETVPQNGSGRMNSQTPHLYPNPVPRNSALPSGRSSSSDGGG